jgi:hypothetical protein
MKNPDVLIGSRLLAQCVNQLRYRVPPKISKDIDISLLQFFEKHKHGGHVNTCAAAPYCTAAVGIPLRTASDAIIAACSNRTILLHNGSGRTAIAN